MTDEFPVERASNAQNVSIWWRHHELKLQVIPQDPNPLRKSIDYVYGIWVYKALDMKRLLQSKKITGFVRETVNRGKK